MSFREIKRNSEKVARAGERKFKVRKINIEVHVFRALSWLHEGKYEARACVKTGKRAMHKSKRCSRVHVGGTPTAAMRKAVTALTGKF